MRNGAAAAPVIAIDGPTASGKGEIARRVAQLLGWHYLDSGALYRVTALAALRAGIALDDEGGLAALARELPVSFAGERILLGGQDVGDHIRRQEVGSAASQIATIGAVREALGVLQRGFRRWPGLVADGRDMGTVVFPDADLKVFLTASVDCRARRRHKQLIEKGFSANLPSLLQELCERDARDTNRALAPLRSAQEALVVDSTQMTIEEVLERIVQEHRRRNG
ncbi:MAG: (d)CMP kinase [Burkholderiaceae bacterium]|nr:(d)CMP kinase [Burkholderiaceae bacterium]